MTKAQAPFACFTGSVRLESGAMAQPRKLTFYLRGTFLERAQRGEVNIVNLISAALGSQGFSISLRADSDLAAVQSSQDPGYTMFHMHDPFHERALTMRLAYFYPYWRIEKSAQRWEWDVAREEFDPDRIDPALATAFCDRLRKRLFKDEAVPDVPDLGYVYIPLQGQLSERRSFQSMSPIDMVREVVRHEPARRIFVTLHPNENYSDFDMNALQMIEKDCDRLEIVDHSVISLVRGCSYIATQNSTVALMGFAFHKPAVLFAKIDFHHISPDVFDRGAAHAIRRVMAGKPDFDRYLYWFLAEHAINAADPNSEQKVLAILRRHQWIT